MHDIFIKTAFLLAEKSKCVSHHVGAVIVKDNRIISMGYNGSPPGLKNCCDHFDKNNFIRDDHRLWSINNEVHAEMNAIMYAAKNGLNINEADIYTTLSPCNYCLKNMIMAGIKNVYYLYLYDKPCNTELLNKINMQEVPGAEEIKKFVEYNNLYYKSINKLINHEKS